MRPPPPAAACSTPSSMRCWLQPRRQHERFGREPCRVLSRKQSCLPVATTVESTLGDAAQPHAGRHWLAATATFDPCRVARHTGECSRCVAWPNILSGPRNMARWNLSPVFCAICARKTGIMLANKSMPAFTRHIGIDYSGAQAPARETKRVFKRFRPVMAPFPLTSSRS